MTRLFFSLYAFIVCGLLAINVISEHVWGNLVEQPNQDLYNTQQLVETLPQLISISSKQHTLLNNLSLPASIHHFNDLFWLEEQKSLLNDGKSVVIFNELENPVFYIKVPNEEKVYQFGPFIQEKTPQKLIILKWVILGISYVLLAVIIAIWLKPLWRDLSHLNSMALSISNGNLDILPKTSTQSPINHVVETFHHMSSRIKRLLEDQKHLVNAVSHELRTPLSRLRFALAIAENKDEEATKGMESDLTEIENLVDEMLGYARLENVNQTIQCDDVDLVKLIRIQTEKLMISESVKFELVLPQHYTYRCNQKLIERAVQNLLINAVKYSRTKVVVSLILHPENVAFIVEDDGVGIEKQDYEQIFEPFYRTHSQLERHVNTPKGGFGLGLAIVKRICDWHKATCHVEQSLQGGGKFVILFSI